MPQITRTISINSGPEQLWVLLNDMIARPERYEPDVVLKKLEQKEDSVHRTVSRDGHRIEEILEVNRDALMIELTVPSDRLEPHLSLIHQIVPAGDRTVLNLAATWMPEEGNSLEDTAGTVDTVTTATMERRLATLGERIQLMAEKLAKQ